MAQINSVLKRTFTGFNVFFAIVGGFVILLSLLSQVFTSHHGAGSMEGRLSGLIVLYTLGAIILIVSALGAYGAHKESKVAMIIFLVCMVIGSLMMLRIGVTVAMSRPMIEPLMEENFRKLLPLDKASFQVKDMAESLQVEMKCCGLFSYKDWRDSIPESCQCDPSEEDQCQNVDYGTLMQFSQRSMSIYTKTCFPILVHYIMIVMDVMIGVIFTLASLAVMGMILSSIIIYQMRVHSRPPIVLTVPAIFGGMPPPKYEELRNPPAY